MEPRLGPVVTYKRRKSSVKELCGSATQLVSIAPTQPQLGESPPPYKAPRHAPPEYRQPQQQDWGLAKEASYWRELDQEALQETEEMSRQTTPGASRAASPGHGGPCTAPQASAADLAAVISQQLTQGTPGTEEILRHWPRVQERYGDYIGLATEQKLEPVPLRAFFKHSSVNERGVPVL